MNVVVVPAESNAPVSNAHRRELEVRFFEEVFFFIEVMTIDLTLTISKTSG